MRTRWDKPIRKPDPGLDAAVVRSRWYTTADVAKMLGVTVHGVRWLARNGRLPYEATASGQRLFRHDEVIALVERRRQRALFGHVRLRVVEP
jgi:excisionase family DNA binding protein